MNIKCKSQKNKLNCCWRSDGGARGFPSLFPALRGILFSTYKWFPTRQACRTRDGSYIKVTVQLAVRLSGTVAQYKLIAVRHHKKVALIQLSDRSVTYVVCSVYMASKVAWAVLVTRELEVVLDSLHIDYGVCELELFLLATWCAHLVWTARCSSCC